MLPRKPLAMALSRIPDPPAARPDREQVRTPGTLAAEFLLTVDEADSLIDRRVVDLGSGTGVLAIGAALLDAASVVGVEVDPGLVLIATEAAATAGVAERVHFLAADVTRLEPETVAEALGGPAEIVIMNPPFGADLASRARGGDRVFLSLAFRLAPTVYAFHLAETEGFLVAYARDAGYGVERCFVIDWALPARFAHHRDAVRSVKVGAYRFTRTP